MPKKTDKGPLVRIVYCSEWGYEQRAAGLAANILEEFVEFLPQGVHLVPGSKGIFDVYLDDKRIFSKKEAGRHVEEREVEDQLAKIFEG